MIQRNSSFASSHEVWKYICELGISKVRTYFLHCLPPQLYYSVFDPAPLSCMHSAEPTLEKHCPKVDRGPPDGLILAEHSPGCAVHHPKSYCSDKFFIV